LAGVLRQPLTWAALALVAAGVRSTATVVNRGWVPLGDDAVIAGLARLTASGEVRLVGMPNSFWQFTGTDSSHPGPLVFVWLAPWVLVLGRAAGSAWGATALSLGVVVGCGWVGRRLGGNRLAVGVMAVATHAALITVAPELHRPLNPYLAALPLFAVLVLAWATSCGVRHAAPALFVAASFATQAHLVFAPVAVGVALPFLVAHLRRQVVLGEGRALALSWRWGALALLLWAAPLYDMLANRGGNVRALAAAVRRADVPVRGATASLRFVLALPGWPPGSRPGIEVFEGSPSPTAVALLVPAAALAAWTWRSGPVLARRALVVLGAAMAAGAVTAWQIPRGTIEEHQLLWYEVVASFFWLVVLLCAAAWLLHTWRTPVTRRAAHLAAVVVLVLNLVDLSAPALHNPDISTNDWLLEVAADVRRPVARAMAPDKRYVLMSERAVPAERLLQVLIADRATSGRPVAVQATDYWGLERGVVPRRSIDGIFIVADVRLGPSLPARLVWGRESIGAVEHARLAADLASLVADEGGLTLTEDGSERLAEALDGHLPGACVDLDRYRSTPERVANDAPGALVELFQQGWVASPELPADLGVRVDEAYVAGLWVYAVGPEQLDRVLRGPEHLFLSRLGCEG